jgi:NAD(P)-dependent dehydrogenase (short-subunit alcohol dehydrogenase family)
MSQARFDGQVILITGGTGALGSAVSRAFLGEGARVAVTYRDSREFEQLQRAAGESDAARLAGWQVDLTNEAEMQRTVAALDAAFGRIDALVHAAGGYAGGTKLWQTDLAVFERMLALNLRAAFLACRATVPTMLRQNRGCIVTVAARAALTQPGGSGAYVASKAAVLALMHSLSADLKGTGIRVNSILPNVIDTAANRKVMPQADSTGWAKPEDIARVIMFLCSADSELINGAAIPV